LGILFNLFAGWLLAVLGLLVFCNCFRFILYSRFTFVGTFDWFFITFWILFFLLFAGFLFAILGLLGL
jgi:hypothetical protein